MTSQEPHSIPTSAKPLQSSHRHSFIDEYRKIRDKVRLTRDTTFEWLKFGRRNTLSHKLPPVPFETQQLCFVLAIWFLLIAVFVSLKCPQYFPHLYSCTIIPLFIYRYFLYRKLKQYPFCFDFCYFANYITMLAVWTSDPFITSISITVSFSVFFASIMWRNSLVFHSIDKLTSCFIHFIPLFALMLKVHWTDPTVSQMDYNLLTMYSPFQLYINGMGYYLSWQFGYAVFFDFLNADLFTQEPLLESSLHYFSHNQHKSSIARNVVILAQKVGFFAPDQKLDANNNRSKIVFYLFQFLYTTCLSPFGWLMYSNQYVAMVLLAIFFTYLVRDGARFYLTGAYVKQRVQQMMAKIESQQLPEDHSKTTSTNTPLNPSDSVLPKNDNACASTSSPPHSDVLFHDEIDHTDEEMTDLLDAISLDSNTPFTSPISISPQ